MRRCAQHLRVGNLAQPEICAPIASHPKRDAEQGKGAPYHRPRDSYLAKSQATPLEQRLHRAPHGGPLYSPGGAYRQGTFPIGERWLFSPYKWWAPPDAVEVHRIAVGLEIV